MKDIENSMAQSSAALARLGRAVTRLEAAALGRPAAAGVQAVSAAVPEGSSGDDLARLTKEHAALKETAGRVAARLDTAIARLTVAMRGED